jgi:hypothetical protein
MAVLGCVDMVGGPLGLFVVAAFGLICGPDDVTDILCTYCTKSRPYEALLQCHHGQSNPESLFHVGVGFLKAFLSYSEPVQCFMSSKSLVTFDVQNCTFMGLMVSTKSAGVCIHAPECTLRPRFHEGVIRER